MATNVSEYRASYTTFSGADVVAVINGRVVGELQGVSYSVTREKVPIYTMGSPDPRSFSRGKRGIAGSMVFTVFNKDAFEDFQDAGDIGEIYTAAGNKIQRDAAGNINDNEGDFKIISVDEWNDLTSQNGYYNRVAYTYADEIFPFDITIRMANEYGQAAKFSILGCEILNEGMGLSIDDITTEKACTFVARGISKLRSADDIISNAPVRSGVQ